MTNENAPSLAQETAEEVDPYAWLEEVEGEGALEWVKARNSEKAAELASSAGFSQREADILTVLDSDEKIPAVGKAGDFLYNFWRDKEHVRGIWRRTTMESYRTEAPDWEILLDLDALGEEESENWVWHGASILRTGPLAYRRALVDLSRGGADADITREFDLDTKTFLPGGFYRSESKGGASWIDEDTLFVATDTGEGTLTSSGYPRIARRWRRGTELGEAEVVFEGKAEDLAITAVHDSTPGFERDFVLRSIDFYSDELFLLREGSLIPIDVPASASAGAFREWLTIELREKWEVADQTFPAGSLLAANFEEYLAGERNLFPLYTPEPSTSLAGCTFTRNYVVLNILDDVKSRLEILDPSRGFASSPMSGIPAVGTVQCAAVDSRTSDDLWVYTTDFLTPTTLSLATISANEAAEPNEAAVPTDAAAGDTAEEDTGESAAGSESENERPALTNTMTELKAMPRFFNAEGLVAEQYFATSQDGTKIPYFLVHRSDLAADGSSPTLLGGYGGFEISRTPAYSGALGKAWLERGGTYALANIRGGGEYGPAWHQAALKQHRHRAYEDMAAVARDLVARRVTTAAKLGVQGGSNGGLLTGNMLTQYPELFGAIIIQVPLLDMKRYSHLLAGASWMAEYGDPDKEEEWEFIRTFSPYHLFEPDRRYPPVLLTTSTRDDRVHPGHARKMAAKMLDAGKDVTYFENIEGGHGGAATNAQAAHMNALAYEFLAQRLGLEG